MHITKFYSETAMILPTTPKYNEPYQPAEMFYFLPNLQTVSRLLK